MEAHPKGATASDNLYGFLPLHLALLNKAPLEVVENLQALEDEGESYETIEDIWPDYPRKDDFLFNEDEY